MNAVIHRVTHPLDASSFLTWLSRRRNVLAIDTETTGLKWWEPGFLRTVQFGDTERAWVVSAEWHKALLRDALLKYEGPVVFHNAKFDMHALESAGLPLPRGDVHDTKIMDHLLDPIRPHSLKAIGDRLWPGISRGQGLLRMRMKANHWTWATIPEDEVSYWAYSGLDAIVTAKIAEEYRLFMYGGGDLSAAYEREIAAQEVLYRAEKRGLRVDVDYARKLGEEWALEMEQLQEELRQFGIENPNAGRQIAEALKDKEGWQPSEWTPTGEPAMTEKILKQLPSEIVPRVLRFKRLRKWSSAYLSNFLTERDGDDRVHPTINTMQARTGRMSIQEPALQTLPRGSEIRDCILPQDDDRRFLAVDYDGQELRVFAAYANEEALIDYLVRDGSDPHRFAASIVYGVPELDVTPAQRQLTKNTQYGLIYGAGASKIAETAGVPVAEAKRFIQTYEEKFPGVREFMAQVEALGQERLTLWGQAYVGSWGGRKLTTEDDGIYRLVNYLVQGSCADVLKQKIVDLDSAGFGDMIALPIHDELLFDIPKDEFEDARHFITEIMHEEDAFRVPLTVHPSDALARWGDVAR